MFACVVDNKFGRIALTWEDAAKGLTDPEVQVVSSEDTVFKNFVLAEQKLKLRLKSVSSVSVAERLAAARKQLTDASSAVASANTGKSSPKGSTNVHDLTGSARVGMTGVMRTREVAKIKRLFVDAPEAIKVAHAPHEPKDTWITKHMVAPGTVTYLTDEVQKFESQSRTQTTIDDFWRYKKNAVSSFKLRGFTEFLTFCRTASDVCANSSKPVATANVPVFVELIDIAIKECDRMTMLGTLGKDSIRLKVLLYLHLMVAVNHGSLYVGSNALRVFRDNVDIFGKAKVPGYAIKSVQPKKRPARAVAQQASPFTGCYLCPATDHFASDLTHHPRNEDGSRKKVSAATKAAILVRVDATAHSQGEKDAEKLKIQEYWTKYSL